MCPQCATLKFVLLAGCRLLLCMLLTPGPPKPGPMGNIISQPFYAPCMAPESRGKRRVQQTIYLPPHKSCGIVRSRCCHGIPRIKDTLGRCVGLVAVCCCCRSVFLERPSETCAAKWAHFPRRTAALPSGFGSMLTSAETHHTPNISQTCATHSCWTPLSVYFPLLLIPLFV